MQEEEKCEKEETICSEHAVSCKTFNPDDLTECIEYGETCSQKITRCVQYATFCATETI